MNEQLIYEKYVAAKKQLKETNENLEDIKGRLDISREASSKASKELADIKSDINEQSRIINYVKEKKKIPFTIVAVVIWFALMQITNKVTASMGMTNISMGKALLIYIVYIIIACKVTGRIVYGKYMRMNVDKNLYKQRNASSVVDQKLKGDVQALLSTKSQLENKIKATKDEFNEFLKTV